MNLRRPLYSEHLSRIEEWRNTCKILPWKRLKIRLIGRPRRWWKGNSKMNLREMGSEVQMWIIWIQDHTQWLASVLIPETFGWFGLMYGNENNISSVQRRECWIVFGLPASTSFLSEVSTGAFTKQLECTAVVKHLLYLLNHVTWSFHRYCMPHTLNHRHIFE
jgi:hypothetical protein